MTQTLFHQDPFLRQFDAEVTAVRRDARGDWVSLTNTAFYYTSGGQPNDTGRLGDAAVLDVVKEDGVIWHLLDRPLAAGQTVHGQIDWARRFDHMCQHAADHMIAGMLYHRYGATTIGLHTGQAISSIDVDMHDHAPRLTRAELDEVEALVTEQIQNDVPIRQWFPTPQELAALPLRKAPTVSENIRVVQIGDFECVACGGTHPRTAGQVGPVKIVSCQPNRGNMRLFFLAGQRALRYFQQLQNTADEACVLLSTDLEALPAHISAVLSQRQQARHDLEALQIQNALQKADELATAAPLIGNVRAAAGVFDGLPEPALRDLASSLIAAHADLSAALFSKTPDKTLCLFAKGAQVPAQMGALLRQTLAPFGGRGGGKPDFAMGSLPAGADLDAVIALYRENLAGQA